MDISEIKSVIINFEVKHPKTDEPIGVMVQLLPPNDKKIERIKRQIQDRTLYLQQRGKFIKADERDELQMALMIAAIQNWDWYGDVDFHGEKPECTEANIRKICNELKWFANQIDEKLNDEKDFFTA